MKINYPNGIKIENKKIGDKSRGMTFEHDLNTSNEYYRIHNMALIYKKPTPVQIVKVDYPARNKARIVEGYYQTPSTTDYNGIYKGKYIDFEAKQTENLSFPFKHIFEHQVNHLKKCHDMGGISFVIIYFKKVNKVYMVDIEPFYERFLHGEKRGISITDLDELAKENKAYDVKIGYAPLIDYLKGIDELYFKNTSL